MNFSMVLFPYDGMANCVFTFNCRHQYFVRFLLDIALQCIEYSFGFK